MSASHHLSQQFGKRTFFTESSPSTSKTLFASREDMALDKTAVMMEKAGNGQMAPGRGQQTLDFGGPSVKYTRRKGDQ